MFDSGTPIAAFLLGGCLMAQIPGGADRAFFDSLRTDISGIYFSQVAHYTPDEIRREFSRAAADPELVSDEQVMANLFFLVRKREIEGLRDGVADLATSGRLKPAAQLSAWKTLYALGSEPDQANVDQWMAHALAGSHAESSPYLPAADRIGGPKTLSELRRLLAESIASQRAAEKRQPRPYVEISRMDKLRASLESQVSALSRKQEILAKTGPERIEGLLQAYQRRPKWLSCWAYRNLIHHASPEAVARAVRAGSDSPGRLRALALLQTLHVLLTPEEQRLCDENASVLQARKTYYYPTCDWEDVLDRS